MQLNDLTKDVPGTNKLARSGFLAFLIPMNSNDIVSAKQICNRSSN